MGHTVQTANVRDLKAHLARYLRLVEAGDSVAVTRHGRPVARIVRSGPGGERPGKLPEAEWWSAALEEGVLLPAEERGRVPRPERGLAEYGSRAAARLVRERRS
ncbi:MAG: type II toxin-antitoxin system prevent-host-death family antitoxin [Planctomycetes bacterium]|nr:type II toxin-antitoxin system prevent-host-death family antitoxin [Planctomycetota bacterium]